MLKELVGSGRWVIDIGEGVSASNDVRAPGDTDGEVSNSSNSR